MRHCCDSIYHKLADTVEQFKAVEHRRKGEHPVAGLLGQVRTFIQVQMLQLCQIPGRATSVYRDSYKMKEDSDLRVPSRGLFAQDVERISAAKRGKKFSWFKKTEWHGEHDQWANEPASGHPRLHERCLPIVDRSNYVSHFWQAVL